VAQAVRDQLAQIDLRSRVRPGARIAIGAGSRGITDYALIVGTVVRELQALGAAPFIFPAMGSHGGATAAGQRGVLAEWGITPERMGCEVHSSMEVVQIGETPTGIPVFCDAGAFNSDGIVLVNRVKIHTDFHGQQALEFQSEQPDQHRQSERLHGDPNHANPAASYGFLCR